MRPSAYRLARLAIKRRFCSQGSGGVRLPAHPPHARARRLDFHQRDQAVDLGLLRNEFDQDTPETQRVLAERRSHPVVTSGRGVALVEDEVDDLKHRRQPVGKLLSARSLEGNARLGECPLCADDALGNRRLRD